MIEKWKIRWQKREVTITVVKEKIHAFNVNEKLLRTE